MNGLRDMVRSRQESLHKVPVGRGSFERPFGKRVARALLAVGVFSLVVPANALGAGTGVSGEKWSLDRLVQIAATENPRVLSGAETVRGAEIGVALAQWQYWPTPSIQSERWRDVQQTTFSLQQPLWTFGRLEAGEELARARYVASGIETGQSRLDIALRVVDAFGRLITARENRKVYLADLVRLEQMSEMMVHRVERGVSAPAEFNVLRSRMNQSQVALSNFDMTIKSSILALSHLVGEELSEAEVGLGAEETGALIVWKPDADILDKSVAFNPSLQRADAEIDVARATVRQANKAYMPTLYARVEHRMGDDGYYYSSNFSSTRILFGLQFSFGPGLSASDEVQAARTREHATYYLREATLLELQSTVNSDIETWKTARGLVEQLEHSVALQREIVESYKRLFLAGSKSWLELLNASRELTDLERNHVNAKMQVLVAAYRLRLNAGDVPWMS